MHDEQVRKLLDYIFEVHTHPMDCDTCQQQFECLAERVSGGATVRELLPDVEAHLACCPECAELFEGLLSIVRAEQRGELG